jgi:glycosyltransferase involved in cell wall biosynthesis
LVDKKEIRIVIIGTGKHFKEFNEMAVRLPNVTMTGWLNAHAISPILNHTDVGLAAYAKDALMSLPNKPFEYMAAGLPLLSSLPGELEQLIEEHRIGLNYEAGNPKSLAEGILWFYNHPEETRQMSERSLTLFSTRFRSDIVYKDFSEYLERIVNCYDRK